MIQNSAVIGESPVMQQVFRQVQRLGTHRWPVLLLGETGTGKERIARALHDVNPRGQFVTIDCSSMVGSLMESELFGHAKGAFTGAIGQKLGLIELANGGTAFFDEVGELPLDLQSKLLRVLQEKEFRPVGALASRRSEFRVIAATNRDLRKEVEKGRFRSDLYYRLNVTSLRLPPLCERQRDILLLVQHFLEQHGRNHQITPDTMGALLSYSWPGNVRELENCIKRMVALNSGPIITRVDLPSTVQNNLLARNMQAMSAAVGSTARTTETAQESFSPILPLAEVERREILRALEYTKGDRVAAAALLGIGRTTLYRKLKEYKVSI